MRIRVAERNDYGLLLNLSQEEGWNYELKDFMIMECSGCSKTLVADQDGIIGMITLFDYGDIGWISNLLVERRWRKVGVGRSLLREGIRMLGKKRTIALFSTQESVPFYLKNGLVKDRDLYFIKFLGGFDGSVKKGEWNESIALMDKICFGYSREPLLRLLAESGAVVFPKDREGFAILRPGSMESTVGPVICNDNDFLYSAMSLLGVGSTAVTPYPNPRFAETIFKVTFMYLGEKPKIDYNIAQAFAGLEYG
ncbi:MAG: GNAT family N-acetyltransferase [Candidatus Methanomethyliaceae archaeon]|nr:GNAT family N-acetyltransferase [Candidatus Methanomethyliaceae archaeon]